MFTYKKIINNLIEKNITISVAESCTGGQLSKLLTDIPRISKIFNMGLITYSNKSKKILLNIPLNILKKHGAVSQKTAKLMCLNLYKISKSRLCISTTGIAGPSGGSKIKPVGFVFFGIIFNKKKFIYKKKFKGRRKKIQKVAVKFCINKIEKLTKSIICPFNK